MPKNASPSGKENRYRARVPMKQEVKKRCYGYLGLLMACFLLGKVFYSHYLLDLLNHFQNYYFIAVVAIGLIAKYYLKDTRLTLISIFSTAIVALPYLYILAINQVHKPDERDFTEVTILTLNAKIENDDTDKIQEAIIRNDADIVSFVEYSNYHHRELHEALASIYPNFIVRPTNMPNGMALYTRLPIVQQRLIYTYNDYGVFSTILEKEGTLFNFINLHPFAPISQKDQDNRNGTIADIRSNSLDKELPLIATGDFNTTLWSPNLFGTLTKNRLKATIFTPLTWPDVDFFPKIGIDHVLVDFNSKLLRINPAGDTGSDHKPVFAKVSL